MARHISSTTARHRLPVAVNFNPLVSAARRSRIRALAVTAAPEISAPVRLASRRIARLLAEGSSSRALKLSYSRIVQAGSTPLSHRRTSGFGGILAQPRHSLHTVSHFRRLLHGSQYTSTPGKKAGSLSGDAPQAVCELTMLLCTSSVSASTRSVRAFTASVS